MRKLSLLLGMALVVLASCHPDDQMPTPGHSFTQIFDHPGFTGTIDPLSVIETPDSGFLVLAAQDQWEVYLLKTDITGRPQWEMTLPEPYVSPVGPLLQIAEKFYLVCMDAVTLGTYLLEVDLAGSPPRPVAAYPELSYPLSAAYTGSEILVQGYDRTARNTTLHVVNPDFAVLHTYAYPILEDKEEALVRHLSRTGKRYPFFCGKQTAPVTSFYFNGFVNYAMTLAMVRPATGEVTGSLVGFRDEEFVNGLYPLPSGAGALSGVRHQDSYLLPATTLPSEHHQYLGDLLGHEFPEIHALPKVVIQPYAIAGRQYIVYGTHAKNNQLLLFFYDQDSHHLVTTMHIGQSNPYEMGDFRFTREGGVLLLAKTYAAGRFPRLALFKLSAAEVAEALQAH